MLNKRFNLLMILLIVISSCATKEVAEFQTSKSQKNLETKLAEDLNLDESTLKKFEVSSTKPAESKKVVSTLKKKTPKKLRNKNTKQASVEVIDNDIKLEESTPIIEAPVDPRQKQDYPPEYIEYDKKYSKVWKKLNAKYRKGEIHKLNISWSIFSAGEITLETLGHVFVGEEEAFGFSANLVSAEYFESIYKLKDKLESFVSRDSFLPIKYTLSQRESGQNVDDLQLFDQKEMKVYFSLKREKKGKTTNKNEEKYTPKYFLDSFSVLHFIRAIDFKVGQSFSIPVMTRAKLWLLNAQVDKVEEITIMGKKVKAYRIKAETQFPGVLKKSGDILFWYSADDLKKLLRFEAKVKIGTIKGELTSYQEGNLD